MVAAILILGAGFLAAAPENGAGSCARCHISVTVEWNVSKHKTARITCVACHGASEGHVAEERNNVKPDRVPQGAAIAPFCRECHDGVKPGSCQTCHHVHALLDPRKKLEEMAGARSEQLARARQAYEAAMHEGETAIARSRWHDAIAQFERALRIRPGEPAATARIAYCWRRIDPRIPGFRPVDDRVDPTTGLPVEVEVGGLGIRMLAVAGGAFDMGDERLDSSRPVHMVRIEPFYLGLTEVTQGQWETIMGANPSFHRNASGAARLPVENVSWRDCQEFLARLNRRVPGGGFRLPTEAEWEFAARGAQKETLAAMAWYRDNSQLKPGNRSDFSDLAPRAAATRAPNSRGFFDMQGNVWEWCSTLFRPFLYNPADGREDARADGLRILKGGSYADSAYALDPALRHSERPDRRFRWNGLRLARTVVGSTAR